MKNILKNRIVVGLACIVLSLAICFGLTPLFNNALTSQVEIVRVGRDIPKGEQITADMLTTVTVGGYNLPVNIVANAEDIVGQYANADLYQGDYILSTKLSPTPMLKNEYLRKLDGSNVAISVTIQTFAKGLSGKLEQGDIVSIIAVEIGDLGETLIYPELTYVEVIAVTAKTGADGDPQAQTEDEDTDLPATITLIANPRQAVILAELEKNSAIHAALVYRGDSTTAQLYLDMQEQYFIELAEAEAAAAAEAEGENGEQADPGEDTAPVDGGDSGEAPPQDEGREAGENE